MSSLQMMTKTYKQRTYLDPIHGPIQLDLNDPAENLLAQIIDTRELQRLRRIKQMGLGSFTFHGAEHTRFGHSLGTLYIARKMISHLAKSSPEIKNYKTEILACALLHDVGHGPLSHTSEKFTNYTHEEQTKNIILGNSEINTLLKAHDRNLPEEITKIFDYKSSSLYMSQIISSYVDCDRLDYLLRDSYYVGVPYGLTGFDRIIASLEIDEYRGEVTSPLLVINETIGLDATIHYLHARYSMYQQVYQHKKNLASDFLLEKIIERARETKLQDTSLILIEWLMQSNTQNKKIDIDLFLQVDDALLISSIENWAYNSSGDKILKDLSKRFISRKIFKSVEFRQEVSEDKIQEIGDKIKSIAKNKDLEPKYYTGTERSASKPYEPYQASKNKTPKAIYIKQHNGLIKELSQISGLVKALSQENITKTCLIYAPELEDDINNMKDFKELFK